MIPRDCKRLIEVDFPIAAVSRHAAREKNIRHGHPSTLHLWWARRPLAACRAVLLRLLLPDPCDDKCPEEFKVAPRASLAHIGGVGLSPDDDGLRNALLRFIGNFADWDLSSNTAYLKTSRDLVKAAHMDELPLVMDPFAGGGSIPLEALRLGCDAFASDLNPVACLIDKVLLEDIPRSGVDLADGLRRVGEEIGKEVWKELAEFYPSDPDGARPIAYLWARTVRCESPNCGAEIPLLRTNWLAKRYDKGKRIYTKLVSIVIEGDCQTKDVRVAVNEHTTPATSLPPVTEPTISGGRAKCPCCGQILSDRRVRAQLADQNGCTDAMFSANGERTSGARLMAVVLRRPSSRGLRYRAATDADLAAVCGAQRVLNEKSSEPGFPDLLTETLSPVRPSPNARGVSGATRIGITDYGRLFTARQKLALGVMAHSISLGHYDPAVRRVLSLLLTKLAERSTSFVTWINSTEAPRGTFARQALTIAWDFIELVPLAGDEEFLELLDAIAEVIKTVVPLGVRPAQVYQADATQVPYPDESCGVWFTDPPYYDSIPYADLSDLFYIWLKRTGFQFSSSVAESEEGLTPKLNECTWNESHIRNGVANGPSHFESTIAKALSEGRRVLSPDGIACVVFAHKTTAGWESLLTGILEAGWVVVASWPVATERSARLNAQDSAALATSVHLVCRPRGEDAGVQDWDRIHSALPSRIGEWMERLSREGIRGADLVFACIGPGLELYSKYTRVEMADGEVVGLGPNPLARSEPARRGFLSYIWEVVGREALGQVLGTENTSARISDANRLEEDARLSALFLWTLQSTANGNGNGDGRGQTTSEILDQDSEDGQESAKSKKGFKLIYDVVRRFAQPLGIHLRDWEGRIIDTEKGVVRLIPIAERATVLFGEEGTQLAAERIEHSPETAMQQSLAFDNLEPASTTVKKRGKDLSGSLRTRREATTLDRVHAAMLLQRSGQTNALRSLIASELDRGPDFLRLANALSALYPTESEEKRLVDAMLLAVRV